MHETAANTCQSGVECATASADCDAGRCRWRCAVDVIDELLREPGAITGAEMDQLLELRWQLGRAIGAEATLKLFCDLRIGMERRHYLAFFRMRRWLENHLVGVRRSVDGTQMQRVPVRLGHYCVEAIRRVCLCEALARREPLVGTRIEFEFVNWPAATAPVRDSALAAA